MKASPYEAHAAEALDESQHPPDPLLVLRALTVSQPYPTLCATGAKRYETRSWAIKYRGWLLLHAGMTDYKGWRENADLITHYAPLSQRPDWPQPAHGSVVGLAFVDALHTSDELLARGALTAQEKAFGDFTPGRWAWHLTCPLLLSEPIRALGAQGLWVPKLTLTSRLPEAVKAHLRAHPSLPEPWPAAAYN